MAKKYKHKSFKGTEAMVEFLNEEKILPGQIVSVNCNGEWRTLVWTEEHKTKEKKDVLVNTNTCMHYFVERNRCTL